MKAIEWIFFDVGETLIDETNSYARHFALCEQKLQAHGVSITSGSYAKIIEHAYRTNQPRPLYSTWRSFTKELAKPDWEPQLEQPYPQTIETLAYLKSFYRLGIIANQIPGLTVRLKDAHLLDYFDSIISSADLAAKKPDPAIFKAALAATHAQAKTSIYIGDRVDNDIIPAKKLGFMTIRIKQGFGRFQAENESWHSDVTIDRIEQLKNIL
ncbi:MAG: HAD family hydrolase [Oenococcus sp.]|uniref:HAD family hydrolase n=1 Tax=Oenococcus TaxID=46254 RepID=UPI0021E992FF|nr:HAD family hydrolase [Oenococcus kitaharae]MCV3295549.1 HAD family hydrolase [Oenococcus kitaharae]